MRGLTHLAVVLLGGTMVSGTYATTAKADFLTYDFGRSQRVSDFQTMNPWSFKFYGGIGGGAVDFTSGGTTWDTDFTEFHGAALLRTRWFELDSLPGFDGVSPSFNTQLTGYLASTEPEDPAFTNGDIGLVSKGKEITGYFLEPRGLLGGFVGHNRQGNADYWTYGAVGRYYTDLSWDVNFDARIGGISGDDQTHGYSFQVGATAFPTYDLKLGFDIGYNDFEGEQSPGFDVEVENWYVGGVLSYRIPGSPFSVGFHTAYGEAEAETQFNQFDDEIFYFGSFVSIYLGTPPNRSYSAIDRYDTPALHTVSGNLMGKPISNDIGLRSFGEFLLFNSDERLKRDITLIARLSNGLGVYRYRYLWSDRVYIGVMAQEMLKIMPRAVHRTGAWLAVNYAAIWADEVLQAELRERDLLAAP